MTLITNWGGEFSREARHLFQRSGYSHLSHAGRRSHRVYAYGGISPQPETAAETPALPATLPADTARAHQLLQQACAEGVTQLDTHEVRPILEAYGLHTLPTWIAGDSAEAVHIAGRLAIRWR